MNIQHLLISVLLLLATGLAGQTFILEVSVVDADTKSPLEFTTVQLVGTSKGGTTK